MKAIMKNSGYAKRMTIGAPGEALYAALTTREGLGGWWTPLVKGDGKAGGELRFEFKGLSEHIRMRVDTTVPGKRVDWTCLEHTSLPEWSGTQIHFGIRHLGASSCELDFQHVDLTKELDCYEDCALGWDHFLGSLRAYVESGKGHPFGT